jgi:methylamine dehydrogenase light chain
MYSMHRIFRLAEGLNKCSIDRLFEHSSRSLARHTSRRSLLATVGKILTGAALIPLLPIDRSSRAQAADAGATGIAAHKTSPKKAASAKSDDPLSCDYWKYCAVDGFLCSCCGGSANSCPPGTAPSPITWIGTCHNPTDGRDYIVSYNDCCGKTSCGNCECNRNEREKPMYRPSRNNDLNWCMANADSNYHCSVSVILGVADE